MARGFFAELQHQNKIAQRERAREEREAERAHKAAIREFERTRKAEERAAKQLAKASEKEQKRLAKESREAHIAAMGADVERRTLELAQAYEDIDSILHATLDVDDFVDLETLRRVAEHPPFDRTDLETPNPPPDPVPPFNPPPPPTGLKGLFGKKRHEKEAAEATASYAQTVTEWENAVGNHTELEDKRKLDLESEKARYTSECSARELEVEENNKAVDKLNSDLSYGAVDAVQEYISIVLSNSVYPDHFPINHEFEFDASTAELRLRVLIPSPGKVPDVSAYKYNKSTDEITEKKLTQKASKDRYTGAVHQVALRSIHEVFEADRRGIVKTISLEVGTETTDPATGLEGFILFVATGAERESFLAISLANVVPAATLSHLGASVSKNPFGLIPADSSGIRRS